MWPLRGILPFKLACLRKEALLSCLLMQAQKIGVLARVSTRRFSPAKRPLKYPVNKDHFILEMVVKRLLPVPAFWQSH
jgi:hypothetical protein